MLLDVVYTPMPNININTTTITTSKGGPFLAAGHSMTPPFLLILAIPLRSLRQSRAIVRVSMLRHHKSATVSVVEDLHSDEDRPISAITCTPYIHHKVVDLMLVPLPAATDCGSGFLGPSLAARSRSLIGLNCMRCAQTRMYNKAG